MTHNTSTEIKVAENATNPFAHLVNLAQNGSVLFATDDFFQPAESLIAKNEPVWDEHKFTPFGKWMDGWETRRKRTEGHDWSIIKLGLSGSLTGVHIDTAYFTGNQTPRISLQAACLDRDLPLVRRSELGTCATQQELQAALAVKSDIWEEILPMVALKPGYQSTRHHYFRINSNKRWTHLRVNYFPDGGVARLRAYGTVIKDWTAPDVQTGIFDLIAMENGGVPIAVSNSHYGTPFNLISKPESIGMMDGWETARNPNRPPIFLKDASGQLVMPGFEWVVFRVGVPGAGVPRRVQVDTAHFRGNFPESVRVEGCCVDTGKAGGARGWETAAWFPIVERVKTRADAKHEFEVADGKRVTHVRLTVYPDGGVARLRVWGTKGDKVPEVGKPKL
ncbi:Allantoicase domain-containing protein, partial [Chytriomyces sp. MP71]